mmetsp:Transcript_15370/g.21723  ORF Transcript_15370/g.21723 Transcript_15370/m.21723 type:complete len:233 (+) Transcript_15370:230-928(+)
MTMSTKRAAFTFQSLMVSKRSVSGSFLHLRQNHSVVHNRERRFLSSISKKATGSSSSEGSSSKGNRLFEEEINIIYDSKCNVCKMEIDFLRKRDEKLAEEKQIHRKLKFTDLEGETGEYDPLAMVNGGITYKKGMASMHAVTADGTVMTGVPVFRAAYEQVGLGWLFWVTKLPLVKQLADICYNFFAKYRTIVTRGKSLESLVQIYNEKKELDQRKLEQLCEDGTCSIEEKR